MRTSAPVGGTSVLLTNEENSVLYSLFGTGCDSLASAVVRYFKGENESNWVLKGCGVVCCIKDKNYKDYFIRIYDVIRRIPLLEQRLFLEMDYTEELKCFHVLQSDDGPVGLAFASLEEAKHFAHTVNGRLRSMRAAAIEKTSSNLHTVGSQPIVQAGIYSLNPTKLSDQGVTSIRGKTKSKGKKQKLTSKDISNPSNFRHIEHVGYDREAKTFDISSQESAIMRNILRAIGREDAMNIPSERTFVYNFAREHGGLEEIQRQLAGSQSDRRNIPATNVPPPRPPPPPPPPPSAPRRQNLGSVTPSQSVTIQHPPPPPVPQVAPKPVAPPPPILPAPPLYEIPAPPPPPPPPIFPSPAAAPPPPPPACPTTEAEKECTSNAPPKSTTGLTVDLQSQIMSFQKSNLRKITPGEGVSRPPVKPSNSNSGSSSTGANPTAGGGGFDLLQSLAQAMEMRRNRMCSNDSGEESDANSVPGDIGSDGSDWET
ncbi:unnamed protein product [Schistosoma intercalatum]|nr:unnamed protein product [Schistosoma intercalatum]